MPNLTESDFKRLATEYPNQLVAIIEQETLDPTKLTFAAESLAISKDSNIVVPCLLNLLNHKSSLVREGAVYGLEGHLNYPEVRARLKEIALNDLQEGVREAATEALE